MADTTDDQAQAPLLRVVNPDATPEEVAALIAAISLTQTPATPSEGIPSEWPVTTRLRNSYRVRPRSWRASAMPR